MLQFNDIDFLVFKRKAFQSTKKKDILDSLKTLSDNKVPEKLFYLFQDKEKYYFEELIFHSSRKSFFSNLLKDRFTIKDVPALESLSTHFSISFVNKKMIRWDADSYYYTKLRNNISTIINSLIQMKEMSNPFKRYLNHDQKIHMR